MRIHAKGLSGVLVDLKYTHVGHKVQVVFEGRRRTFQVDHVSAEIPTGDDEIISRLGSLEIGSVPQLWTAGWDTQISLKQETDHDKSSTNVRNQFQFQLVSRSDVMYSCLLHTRLRAVRCYPLRMMDMLPSAD